MTDRRYSGGARADGATDDTAAVNAAIRQSAGGTVFLPSGTYLVSPSSPGGVAIILDMPGTRLVLDPGAVIQMAPNNLENYSMVQVTAHDCVIEGGAWIGDVASHTGSTGEWGHCIDVRAGADRAIVRNTVVSNAWGDGIFISGHPADVSINGVTAKNNRRQGLSINDALRPRVTGGVFTGSGSILFASPGGGVVVEPDADTDRSVIDASLTGVMASGNRGAGFWVSSNGRPVSCVLSGCKAVGTVDGDGFIVSGAKNSTSLNACEAVDNSKSGFLVDDGATSTIAEDCFSRGNGRAGFLIAGKYTNLRRCGAESNGSPGYYLDQLGEGSELTDSSAAGNVRSVQDGVEIDIYAAAARLHRVTAHQGTGGGAAYGIAVRASAKGCVLTDCSVRGAFTRGRWISMAGDTLVDPEPGR